jgi:hypothetical protein
VCDIVTGGEWKFIMRSAEGIEYPNLSTWIEVEQDHVCIEHLNAPHFLMRADFKTIRPNSTEIIWTGTFDTPEIFAALKPIIIPANEQNLDRLEMCLNTL